jgi:hypothetical protein
MITEALKQFDDIRPFEPEELPEVYDRMLADPQFIKVLAFLYPGVPVEAIAAKMRQCATNIDFQKEFCYGFLKKLLEKVSTGYDFDTEAIDIDSRYTFISNHRDIVLDSALLDVLLYDAHCSTTCEIAIGDNLLSLPWVKDLVRINKSFIVERRLQMRQMLMASKRLSEYLHFVMNVKHDNIWIAQREGRAKDSNDRTQESILKMMTMGGEGNHVERLLSLHIVPLAISYEYDPCDFLKAREFQLRRDVEGWKKGPTDDIVSMQTGILGYKGKIHYHCAPCIDEWLKSLDPDMPKTEFYPKVAEHIDEEIFRNYRLYAGNYVAADLLEGNQRFASHYTEAESDAFKRYLDGQLAKVDLQNADTAFLRERILTMYANPAINQASVLHNA